MSELKPENNGSKVSNGGEQRPNGGGGGDECDACGWASSESSYIRQVAKMPVHRNATHYKMNHKNRGIALIFNHENFDIPGLYSRKGTNLDCDNLHKVLETLGFRVNVHHNPKSEEINRYIQDLAGMDHTDNDCVLVAVMSHGEHGMLYAKDTHYKPDNLWYYFTADKCPTLAGKPKLFFIQACQGDKYDDGITLAKSNRTETDGVSSSTYRIPIHADFLIVFSTVPGYFSWRDPSCGSWFMQALCEELRYVGTERDILTLLTFVCQKVALDNESNTLDIASHQKKQVPYITSMLTRLLVFDNNKDRQGAPDIITQKNTDILEPGITPLEGPIELSPHGPLQELKLGEEKSALGIAARWRPRLFGCLAIVPLSAHFALACRSVESALNVIDNIKNAPNK